MTKFGLEKEPRSMPMVLSTKDNLITDKRMVLGSKQM